MWSFDNKKKILHEPISKSKMQDVVIELVIFAMKMNVA